MRNDNAEGVKLYQQGNYLGAVNHFQQALAKQPGNPDCFYNLGATYHQQAKLFGRPADMQTAEQYYHLCLARNPNHEACQRALAVLLVEENRSGEAIAQLEEWAPPQPANPESAHRARPALPGAWRRPRGREPPRSTPWRSTPATPGRSWPSGSSARPRGRSRRRRLAQLSPGARRRSPAAARGGGARSPALQRIAGCRRTRNRRPFARRPGPPICRGLRRPLTAGTVRGDSGPDRRGRDVRSAPEHACDGSAVPRRRSPIACSIFPRARRSCRSRCSSGPATKCSPCPGVGHLGARDQPPQPGVRPDPRGDARRPAGPAGDRRRPRGRVPAGGREPAVLDGADEPPARASPERPTTSSPAPGGRRRQGGPPRGTGARRLGRRRHQLRPAAGGRRDPPLGESPAYVHVTSNETIQGVQWKHDPDVGPAPLVCDCSSDFLSRPIDVARYGLIYACAQKNAGIAGVTAVIIRKDLLERSRDDLPTMLDYRTHVKNGSRPNTPPVFADLHPRASSAAGSAIGWGACRAWPGTTPRRRSSSTTSSTARAAFTPGTPGPNAAPT